jgi:hypothetical protein
MAEPPGRASVLQSLAQLAQVLSVVVGVVITVLSFNHARVKEAEAREREAAKPYLDMRQRLYAETVKTAGVLANPETHSEAELAAARKRFRELYVAELSMVEAPAVERYMIALAAQVDPELVRFTPAQKAAYDLAHALQENFTSTLDERDGGPAR